MSSVIDEKGRITIPKELRKKMGLETGETIDFIVVNEKILLNKKIDVKSFLQRSDQLATKFDKVSKHRIEVEKLF